MFKNDSLSPVPQNSLADIVTAQLRAAIISGQLAPGEKLTEVAMAERLGVSRSPVREALKRLEVMGLVRSQLNYSTYVWDPTAADVDEIVNLRNMIEIYASEQVVRQLTEFDYVQLTDLINDQERSIQNKAYLDLVHSDRAFHEFIVRKSNNTRLLSWWDQIMGQWEVLVARRWRFDTEKVIPRVLKDHRMILNALYQRDVEQLVNLHRTINNEVCEETKRMLQVQASTPDSARRSSLAREEVVTAS